MKHLYFVRHGLSEMNKAMIWTGGTDSPLAAEGHVEAEVAGQKIKKMNISVDLIISSPLSRALTTAQHIADAISYSHDKIVIRPDTVERDFGSLEGNKKLVAATKYMFNEDAIDGYAGVEKIADLQKRADDFWGYLQTLQQDTIVVVGHGAFARALKRSIDKTPISNRDHRLENAEIMRYV